MNFNAHWKTRPGNESCSYDADAVHGGYDPSPGSRGSYLLQRGGNCGKACYCCANADCELHGPYWYHNWKMDRKSTKSLFRNRSERRYASSS